ncbi:baseplate assembly protein [Sphingomonas oryzagri]|uniref:Baseplate J/gp47 family protein n=1 Tax=Sphingomonas oryzagri TaxID=3042314 RepID=A0ABT6N7Q4_9SPHN|nr:baseplate J/gp47 family protein [Sphingomonas oryzagri]MDH7641157.1 baseplate J/gp47 family protein [Sphingomonas oryzagri]
MADTTSSSTYTAVDLSRLPAPEVVETLDFEAVYAQMAAGVSARLAAQNPPISFDPTNEADPAVAVLQEAAYHVTVLRARVNDAAKACMVAYATGADLENLLALLDVERLVITPANPDTGAAAVEEADSDFRSRGVLAPEGFSVAGPEGAYIFHARSADSRVADASATSPAPCQVVVTILARAGDGTAPADLIDAVSTYLASGDRRPLTDLVTVQSASIVDYVITATLITFAGPDSSVVIAQAQSALADYLATTRGLGRDVTRAGIIAALKVEGIQNVLLAEPAADIALDRTQASNCTAITITNGGLGE